MTGGHAGTGLVYIGISGDSPESDYYHLKIQLAAHPRRHPARRKGILSCIL